MTVTRFAESAHTRNRAKTAVPLRRRPRKTIVGARLPRTVVEVALTTSVASDRAVAEPLALVAVTATRSELSTSTVRTPYVRPVAPMILAHAVPSASHLSQWKLNDVGSFVHRPRVAVSSWPTKASPRIAGLSELTGAPTTPVRAVVA